MRHLFIVCVLIGQFGLGASAFAQLLAYEGFDYKEGSSLTGANGGVGWKDAWFSRGNATKGCTIGQPQSHPGLETSGNCCLQDGTDIRICRYIDTSRPEVADLVVDGANGKTFGKDGTTIWISFLISCTSFPKLAHGGIHFMDGIVPALQNFKSTQRLQLGRQNKGDHWMLIRVDQGGPAAGSWDGTVSSDDKQRLLVYRFDFKAGAEEGWMWVDPEPAKEPDASKADVHASKIADFRMNAVNLGSGGGATFIFDELRVATTYAEVAPAKTAGKEAQTEGKGK
jgi:hypothetical protein